MTLEAKYDCYSHEDAKEVALEIQSLLNETYNMNTSLNIDRITNLKNVYKF